MDFQAVVDRHDPRGSSRDFLGELFQVERADGTPNCHSSVTILALDRPKAGQIGSIQSGPNGGHDLTFTGIGGF
jgi:hypothetical protein